MDQLIHWVAQGLLALWFIVFVYKVIKGVW